jgi:hypothetical protein
MPEDTMGFNWEDSFDKSDVHLYKMILKDRALKPGRLLQNPTPQVDPETKQEYHTYRRILAYDRVSEAVKISKEGSKLNPELLEETDEETTANALYNSEISQFLLRSSDWDITK